MLRCANGSLYTGITTDVARRFAEHQNQGVRCAKCLRGKGPLSLVYQESAPDRAQASRREWHLKQLSKQEKESLVGSVDS